MLHQDILLYSAPENGGFDLNYGQQTGYSICGAPLLQKPSRPLMKIIVKIIDAPVTSWR